YSPDNVHFTRDDGGDILITWNVDDRFGGEPDSIYSIDIYNSDWSAVVRRINALDTSVNGNQYNYFIEEQIIDGTNEQYFQNLLIYQINASHVGRGYPGGGRIEESEPVDLGGIIDADPSFVGNLSGGLTLHDLAGTIDVDPAIEGELSGPRLLLGLINAN